MSALPAENSDPLFLAQEAAIAELGGVDPMYDNNPGKLRATNAWVDVARPVIETMAVLNGQANMPLALAIDSPAISPYFKEALKSAQVALRRARERLELLLSSIRDDCIADEIAGRQDDAAAQDEADDFNTWLEEQTISVDDAIKHVGAR